jgi:glycylpeptide N-tetradecanoyltransferase
LKAADLMKMLDGQKALGNKVGTKALGEHKVSYFSTELREA